MLQQKQQQNIGVTKRKGKPNLDNKRKSYSQLLGQLTREQSERFDNGSHFMFDRNPSLSTINNITTYVDIDGIPTEPAEIPGTQLAQMRQQGMSPKINIKEILKSQVNISANKEKQMPFLRDES